MKLSEFMVLTTEEKRAILVKEGVPIAKRDLLKHMVFLFQLSGYYVETYCSKQSKAIEEYRVFHDPEFLIPYLQAINIEKMY
ncbi:MAG: hypothetical protein HYX40_12715 [Sphingobacteriales bacterium]|nr:hypothetical protein [Sphingobacteriales bacterium]